MFKIISRKKYKELLAAQELADARNARIDVLKLTIKKDGETIAGLNGRVTALREINDSVESACYETTKERDLLAEEFRKAEDCIDDVYTLLNAISDKCNINALKAAKNRVGLYYTDPKVNAAINLAGQCMPAEREINLEENNG